MGLDSLGPYVQNERSRKNLYIASFASSLMYISTGCVLSWTSTAIEAMKLTPNEASWLGSLYALGAAVGPAFNGLLLDRVGRKAVLIMNSLFFLVHWTIIGSARSDWLLYIGRIIGGFGVGGGFAIIPVYIAEISDETVRGPLGSLNQFFLSIGVFLEYGLGAIEGINQATIGGVGAGVGLISTLALMPLPESPLFYLAKGERNRARASLAWIRGNPPPFALQRELDEMEECLEEERRSGYGRWKEVLRCRALWICFLMMAVQQLTGLDAIIAYTQEIFESAMNNPLPPSSMPMIIGALNVVSSIWSPILIRWYGLKAIFIIAAHVTGLAMLLLASYFYVLSYDESDVYKISFLPLTSLVIYYIFSCVGVAPIPWTIAGEMFSTRLKGKALTVLAFEAWILSFFAAWGFEWVSSSVGIAPVLTFFGVGTFISALALQPLLIDSRGLSLQDIQDLLNGPSSHKKNCYYEG